MAGAYWHFYIANLYLEKSASFLGNDKNYRCMTNHRELFLAGVQGPDFNFYPGGDGQLSSLAHGDQPSDLGRAMLKLAETEEERAFAYGWLMHLTTDNIVHPLVHQFMMEHFPRQCRNGSDYNVYPLGHHRVEWGIDSFMLQDQYFMVYLPILSEVIVNAERVTSLVDWAYREVFDYPLIDGSWASSIRSMIKYENIFEKVWHLTGRMRDPNPIKQVLKGALFHAVAAPILKLIGLKNPEGGAGVFLPIKPTPADIDTLRQYSEQVCRAFEGYLPEDFVSLPNDTDPP